jgi:hypothetical protein
MDSRKRLCWTGLSTDYLSILSSCSLAVNKTILFIFDYSFSTTFRFSSMNIFQEHPVRKIDFLIIMKPMVVLQVLGM